jgi:uncharacterized protein
MKILSLVVGLILVSGSISCAANRALVQAGVNATATGIALDTDWKKKVYAFALQNVVHPAWGISHSERDYQTTKKVAAAANVVLDFDVLFAAAFLHDIGGIGSFEAEGVDHAVRSVQVIEPLLREWGFPMNKWADVKDMIIGHIYYGPAPKKPQDQAFRDADILDFLGSMGVARIFAVTEESGGTKATLQPSMKTLRNFESTLPEKLSLESSRSAAKPLVEQMKRFFKDMDEQSLNGNAL